MTYSESHRRGRYDFALGEDYDEADSRYDFDSDEFEDEDDDDFDRAYVGGVFRRHGFYGAASEKAVQAHSIVQTFVNTFAGEGRRYNVTFDETVSTAGTSFEGRSVVITTRPLHDPALTIEQVGEILTAMAAHEVSHDRYGLGTAEMVRAAFRHDPRLPLASKLSNILDDVRIERRFVGEYPGYAGIFDPMLEYVAGMSPNAPSPTAPSDIAVCALRYSKWTDWSATPAGERKWWSDWGRKWAHEDAPARHLKGIREALDHIAAVGGEDIPEDERTGRTACAGEALDDSKDAAASGDAEAAQKAVVAAQKYVDNGPYGKIEVNRTSRGMLDGSQHAVRQSAAAGAAIRAAFMRSRTGHTAVDRNQRTGRLDQRSLNRVAMGRTDLFEKRRAPSPRRVRVFVMIDCSSSMAGSIDEAASVAMALADGASHEQHVSMSVWGWTNPPHFSGSTAGAQVIRVWGSGEATSKIADLTGIDQNGTPDAAALHWAVKAIKAECRDGEKPLIVFGSDGFGDASMNDEVKAARAAGVDVRSVALGQLDESAQAQRFGRGHYVKWAGSIEATARPLANMVVEASR